MGVGMEPECWLKGEEAPVPCGHPGTASRHTTHKQARSQAGQIVLVLRAATGVGTQTRTGLGEDRLCAATFVLGPPGIQLLPGLQLYLVGCPLGPPPNGHAP